MLSPSVLWKIAVLKSGSGLRHLVVIDDGTTQWKIVDGICTDSTMRTYEPALLRVDAIAAEVDPKDHSTQVGRISLAVQDAWARPVVVANRMKGMKVSIALGEAALAESDFEVFFTGFLDEVAPEPFGNVIMFECLDTWSVVKDQPIVGAWADLHPLEVIEDIFANKLGLDATLYDATGLDPSTAANAASSHLVATRIGAFGVPWFSDDTVREATSAKELTNELLEIVNGSIVPGQDGKLTVKIFDPDAAAVVHWDDDEIDSLRQLEEWDTMVNHVSINAQLGYAYEQNDTDSQGNHAYGLQTARVLADFRQDQAGTAQRIDNKWIKAGLGLTRLDLTSGASTVTMQTGPGMAGFRSYFPTASQPADARPLSVPTNAQTETSYDNNPTTEGTFAGGTGYSVDDEITLSDGTVVTVDALSGSAVLEFTVDSSASDGTAAVGDTLTQSSVSPAGGSGFTLTLDVDNATETRPLYWLLNTIESPQVEIVKVTTQPTLIDYGFATYWDPWDEANELAQSMMVVTAKIQRAQLGTSASAFTGGSWVIDITPQVFMASNILDRFGASSPRIEVATSLKQMAVEVGDFVTMDWAPYVGYGADGIDNTTKWEVTSKEVDPYADSPGIRWTLVRATVGTSTRTHRAWTDSLNNPRDRSRRTALARNHGGARVVNPATELKITQDAGLVGDLSGGVMADAANEYNAPAVTGITFTASADTYVYHDVLGGGVVLREVALGGTRPTTRPGHVAVAKVVTDGSGITTITDLTVEHLGTADAAMLNLDSLTNASDCPNGSFGEW